MPDLLHSLQSQDIGHLRIVAGFWGLDMTSPELQTALQELVAGMLDPHLVAEIFEALPPDSQQALLALVTEKGRIPWQEFTRRFGQLRDAGMGRRDREQVHLHPVSSTELLFYRALLGHAFFETSTGTQEFAYIPDDLQPLLPVGRYETVKLPGRLATPQERFDPIPATDRILDDACTLLTALRMGWQVVPQVFPLSLPQEILLGFLQAVSLVESGSDGTSVKLTHPEQVRSFLEAPRPVALLTLVNSWLASTSFNELRQVPSLICEGTWMNDPLATRRFILDLLKRIPPGKWWSLSSFVAMIHEDHPDFQRPSADFTSWLIRDRADGAFLHGFEHWEQVEGSLVRYIICGPLHWLGLLDLASAENGSQVTAFRLSGWSGDLLNGRPPQALPVEDGKLHAAANGRISIPLHLPRSVRYQVARFCTWESFKNDEYRYRLTPLSLKTALRQGLKVSHLLTLLKKFVAAPLPPSFIRALDRWELNGTEAWLEQPVILRLSRPEVLDELRKSRAGRFLGRVFGPTSVEVKPGATAKVLAALAEIGLLTEDQTNADIINSGEINHN